jgi:hypothetical protein
MEAIMIELREFVRATLLDVLNGVDDARKDETVGARAGITWTGRTTSEAAKVEFDVAVTAENTDAAKGNGGVKVAVFSVGVSGEVSSKNTTVSRIKFAVPIRYTESLG